MRLEKDRPMPRVVIDDDDGNGDRDEGEK